MNRRGFLASSSAALSSLALPSFAQGLVKVVILGAGAGGLALANRLSRRLPNATITLIDGRIEHWYQPGLTLVGSDLVGEDYPVTKTKDWVPSNVHLIEQYATSIQAHQNRVTIPSGSIDYDYLVVAPGIKLDWDAIEGFDLNRIGPETGVAAIYAGPKEAKISAEAQEEFNKKGGRGIFFRPPTELKCAGAPIKYTFLTHDKMKTDAEINYFGHNDTVFGVPIYNEIVRNLFDNKGINYNYNRVLKSIDMDQRQMVFDVKGKEVKEYYDFTNIVPHQRASDVIRMESDLSTHADGWVDCDNYNLRSSAYSNVFALGDCAGVRKGKTAASVKWQVPVVEDHLVAQIEGREGTKAYNGYTSCPMITEVGKAILVEFDYDNNVVPSFPGIIDSYRPSNAAWLIKKSLLKPTYYAMLQGDA